MATINEDELFDVALDEPAEHSVDRLQEVAVAMTDELMVATEDLTKEQNKPEPNESAMAKVWKAWDAAKAFVDQAQEDVQAWFDAKEVEERLGADGQKRLDDLVNSMPGGTRERNLAKMREWAHGLPTRIILRNRTQLGKGPGADDARRVYDEELRRRQPPAPRQTKPRTEPNSAPPRRVSKAMVVPLANYHEHRVAARSMTGEKLMDSYFSASAQDGDEALIERTALRNEWHFRARGVESA